MTLARHREAKNTYRLPQGEAIRKELGKFFRAQRLAILDWLATGKKDMGDPLPDAFPDWNDFGLGNLAMSERMAPKLEAIWDEQGAKFTAKIGLDANDWEVNNPHVADAIDKASLDFCTSTNETTSLDLEDALAKTREALKASLIEKGESVAVLTKRIKAIFDGAETWRARRIATSEASRATHAAQEMAAAASGVVTGWELLISEDACPLCQTIKRRVPAVKLGQAFAVIGTHPSYATIKHPPLHVSCQCSMNEILDIDKQPKWVKTLHDPVPEEEDYAPGEAPESARPKKPAPPKAVKPKPAAPKKVKPLVPAGKPVGEALAVAPDFSPNMQRQIKGAKDAIDKVHGDGNLPKIPIEKINKGPNAGQMTVVKGKPTKIDIHTHTETPRITAAHEIGHFLDWSGIEAKHRGSLGQIDYRKDPRFNGFLEAVDKSDTIQSLKDVRLKESVTVVQGKLTSTCKVDKRYVNYLLQDHEVFARAYSQWIATRSEDPEMMAELSHMIRFGEKRTYKDQWDHDDFKPIAAEIDKLFKGLGWLR